MTYEPLRRRLSNGLLRTRLSPKRAVSQLLATSRTAPACPRDCYLPRYTTNLQSLCWEWITEMPLACPRDCYVPRYEANLQSIYLEWITEMPSACPRDCYVPRYTGTKQTTLNATGLPGGYLRSSLSHMREARVEAPSVATPGRTIRRSPRWNWQDLASACSKERNDPPGKPVAFGSAWLDCSVARSVTIHRASRWHSDRTAVCLPVARSVTIHRASRWHSHRPQSGGRLKLSRHLRPGGGPALHSWNSCWRWR